MQQKKKLDESLISSINRMQHESAVVISAGILDYLISHGYQTQVMEVKGHLKRALRKEFYNVRFSRSEKFFVIRVNVYGNNIFIEFRAHNRMLPLCPKGWIMVVWSDQVTWLEMSDAVFIKYFESRLEEENTVSMQKVIASKI